MIRRLLSAVAVVALLGSAQLAGSTITSTWNGGTGNWSTPADWTPPTVPNNAAANTYDVTIASGASGGDSVTLDTSPSINSLVLGGGSTGSSLSDQTLNPQTLTIAGPLTINSNGALGLTSSTVNVGATSSNAGAMNVGTNFISSTASIMSISGDLTNTGSITVGAASPPPPGPSSTLTVAGTLTNQHSLVIQGNLSPFAHAYVGATANLGALVNNGNTIIEAGATLNVTNEIANLPVGSSLSVGGTINSGGNSHTLTGLSSIAGSLGFGNGQSNTITPTGGTLTLSGNLGADPLFGTTGSLVGVPSTVTINGALVLTGTARIETSNGSSLTVTNGITDIPAGASISVQGAFSPTGLASIEGTLAYAPGPLGSGEAGGGTITPNGATLTVSGTLSSTGSSQGPGIALGDINGRLAVAADGKISIGQFGEVDASNGIVNNGTITIAGGTQAFGAATVSGGGMVRSPGGIVNNGSLALGNGAFLSTIAASEFTNEAGATLSVAGSVFPPDNGTFTNRGMLAEEIFHAPANDNTCTGNNDCGSISSSGDAVLGGTLDPILENGFDPTNGESFIFLTASSITGEFSSIEDLNFNNGTQYWVVTYGSDFVELTAAAVPESATILLFGTGLTALGMFATFRRRRGQ